jgi:hypothetical protein
MLMGSSYRRCWCSEDLYFLKKQPGHAEFISASHQDGYPFYRQFIAKHVFYFASEMPIYIGMTPHFISRPCWCRHQQAAMHPNFELTLC